MSEVTFSVTIQGDSEGFVTLECPFCESEFKVDADEFQSEEAPVHDLYCPYCGLTADQDQFYSKETVEHINALVINYRNEVINKALGKMTKSFKRSNSIIKMTYRPLKKVNVKELKDKDTVEEIFTCNSCDKREKVLFCAGASKIYCTYCGVDIS